MKIQYNNKHQWERTIPGYKEIHQMDEYLTVCTSVWKHTHQGGKEISIGIWKHPRQGKKYLFCYMITHHRGKDKVCEKHLKGRTMYEYRTFKF